MSDRWEAMFERQKAFMDVLRENDRLPEFPVDLTTKPGQRLVKEMLFNMIEELMEASFTLKNKMHRLTDARSLDIDHYKEELGDALAFFLEVCIVSGFTPKEIFEQFEKKSQIVLERIRNGY